MNANSTIDANLFEPQCSIKLTSDGVEIGAFCIQNGLVEKRWPKNYCFDAPTALINSMRVARGLASDKPIMLEGSPGAGKSSLIKAMAELTGNELIRINLSDQTVNTFGLFPQLTFFLQEVSDLFGADVPITLSNGKISFEWQDGPVLKAIKHGAWLLLDEMNLASQSILEALNSCFDFRNELYIAELNRRFEIPTNSCRFFACQNPEKEGGGRKALPKSFLNRFTKIYVSAMNEDDLRVIVRYCLPEDEDGKLTDFYIRLHHKSNELISVRGGNIYAGAPLEYNLRDLLRLIECSKEVKFTYFLILIPSFLDVN
jgi:midasin